MERWRRIARAHAHATAYVMIDRDATLLLRRYIATIALSHAFPETPPATRAHLKIAQVQDQLNSSSLIAFDERRRDAHSDKELDARRLSARARARAL